jgi:DNA-directed RNA polymerase delta subunit
MNFFKKISLFFTYSSVIKSIKNELEMEFNARVDRISRIYTVLNIPVNLIEEPYNLRATDIDSIKKLCN